MGLRVRGTTVHGCSFFSVDIKGKRGLKSSSTQTRSRIIDQTLWNAIAMVGQNRDQSCTLMVRSHKG